MAQPIRSILAVVVVATLLAFAARAEEEVCATCEKSVVVSGDVKHTIADDSVPVTGASPRELPGYREEIYGKQFTVTVPDLEAGTYTAVFGMAEVYFKEPGQRRFSILQGTNVVVADLDLFIAAGGAGKALHVESVVNHPGGDLSFTFTATQDRAKLNVFELMNETRRPIFSIRAADLISKDDTLIVSSPDVSGPVLWKDPTQPTDVRIKDLLSRMSLVEKAAQMRDRAPAIPRLGLPAYGYWNECLHGVARAGVATVFPQAIGMAATWDEPLFGKIGDVIATEARAKHNDYAESHNGDSARYYGLTFWTPNINIYRDPRWGRGQETYGEDPFLTSRLGVSFIRGLQGDDPKYIKAMACAKHFAVHSGPEPDRHKFDAEPPERDFYETYLPHFEAAVREGHVGAVMGAYNAVYGEPACSSTLLLNDLLRNKWGFDGHVVSDCGAINDIYSGHLTVSTPEEASARAVKAGCDLCCGTDYNSLYRAVKLGLITEAEMDKSLGRLLDARFRLGLFDPPEMVRYARIPLDENDTPEHSALALKTARESVVLLKNDGLLPLNRKKYKRIAVIGANADSVPMLLGNYNGRPSMPVTILSGIMTMADPDAQVSSMTDYPLATPKSQPNARPTNELAKALAIAKDADVVIYVGGLNADLEREEREVNYEGFAGGDRTRIELPAVQSELLRALKATGTPVVFVNCSGGAIAMPWEAANLPAIVQAWYPGQAGGYAVAELLFGDLNPSGRLPVTFYRSTEDLPAFEDYAMTNRTYRYFTGKPLFAFGHGLSYTQFKYSDAKLDPSAGTNKSVILSLKVKNTGKRDGDEVVQVYFHHKKSAVSQPQQALCGFRRVHVPRGDIALVTVEIPVNQFRYWDTTKKQYTVEPGDYEILIGAASDDIRTKVPLHLAVAD